MGAATPIPNTNPDEAALDAILNNIDKLADYQCKKATARKTRVGDTFSGPVEIARFKKTRAVFQAMSESSLELAESNGNLPAMQLPAAASEEDEDEGEETVSMLRPTTWFPKAKKLLS